MSEWEWIGGWSVQVNGVGVIGTVDELIDTDDEENEERARRSALSKFGVKGPRCFTGKLPMPYIYEDDDFSVKKL